ncbi:MAG: peptidylprolyl isomerase [Lewinellaceae bacterium]|nr:peptidylprolyl isomerase [Phaeodactylibacter sp.]MCB0614996.1 peptidylprolyl isomerase [Phaeodactylibacter sp.]MCB9348494.1 peptidylprolyl isomerase [Lewinellaceae bacterium]
MRNFAFIVFFSLLLWSCNQNATTYALIETEFGNVKVELYNSTPKHKANFIKLANEGFYDDLLFHRVIPGFMIQGGDPDSKNAQQGQPLGQGGPGYTLDAEIGEVHVRGALAAARLADQANPERQSSGSQFYIVSGQKFDEAMLNQVVQQSGIQYTPEQRKAYLEQGGYPPLDGAYTVFGRVVDGMEVVDKIAAAQRDQMDRPLQDIRMKVSIID